MQFSDELKAKAKQEFKGKDGKEMTDAEVDEALDNLAGLFDIMWKMAEDDAVRKARLKKEPKGFPVEGHYNCIVCYRMIDPETGWYDHNNQKCLPCQKAVDDGVLPSFVCHHRPSFFLSWELKEKFNVHPTTARKLVREGKLVARIVQNNQNNQKEYVFLKKENPALIERYSAERKSYDRHRAKVAEASSRRMKAEMLAEKEKLEKKYKRRSATF